MNDSGTMTPISDDRTQEEIQEQYYTPEERAGAIKKLEIQIAAMKERIEMRDVFLRLEKNTDFQKVIEKGYIEDTRNSMTKILGRDLPETKRADTCMVLAGVGALQCYLEGVMQFGASAELQLPAAQDELQRIQAMN